MLTGWVLLVVLTNGLQPSIPSAYSGFLSETECKQVAAQSVTTKDRWICFRSNR